MGFFKDASEMRKKEQQEYYEKRKKHQEESLLKQEEERKLEELEKKELIYELRRIRSHLQFYTIIVIIGIVITIVRYIFNTY